MDRKFPFWAVFAGAAAGFVTTMLGLKVVHFLQERATGTSFNPLQYAPSNMHVFYKQPVTHAEWVAVAVFAVMALFTGGWAIHAVRKHWHGEAYTEWTDLLTAAAVSALVCAGVLLHTLYS
jgi:hypothetical protein